MPDATGPAGRLAGSGRAVHLLRDGLAVPLALVATLVLATGLAGVPFGNVVLGLTLVVSVAWVLFADLGGLHDEGRPSGGPRQPAAGTLESAAGDRAARPSATRRLLVALTGTTVLGWALLLLRL